MMMPTFCASSCSLSSSSVLWARVISLSACLPGSLGGLGNKPGLLKLSSQGLPECLSPSALLRS